MDHPTADEIEEYALRKVIGQRVARIEDHVAGCETCATLLRVEVRIARTLRDLERRAQR